MDVEMEAGGTDEWMGERTGGQVRSQVDGWIVDGELGRWVMGWIDEWIVSRQDGWMVRRTGR